MTDLIQYVEYAQRNGLDREDPFAWRSEDPHLVPAANRRRILDREHAEGRTPDPDGWLRIPRVIADDNLVDGRRLTLWRRIRWEAQPHTEIRELDRSDV